MNEPVEPGQAPAGQHWGAVDSDLLYDTERYSRYALAHHVAGHHYALWRLGESAGPAGLSVDLPRRLWADLVIDAEATALLIEALAVEYVRDLHRLADFGLLVDDVNWDEVRSHLSDLRPLARQRGCRFTMQASRMLSDEGWLHEAAWHALREWDEIAALADALGCGRVLEPDEVDGLLSWWRA